MSVRRRPGTYVERVKNVRTMNDLPSTSIGGIIGEVVRGPINEAVLLTSWTQFQDTFAKGIANPFTIGEVAKAVFGFFQNGGTEVYVVRVASNSIAKAQGEIEGLTISALEGGSWGNSLGIAITENEGVFTLKVSMQGLEVETINKLTEENFVEVVNETSAYVRVSGESVATGTVSLQGGVEGSLTAPNYTNGLKCFDVIEDINMLAITGVTIEGVQEGLVEYCDARGNVFPIVDAPSNATIEEVKDFKDKLSSFCGSIHYPEIEIVHPITGKKEYVAPSGHLMGMFARTDATRGIHKAPAGLEATLKGAVSVRRPLSETEIAILNDYEINCIIPKKGSGIVSWGARLLKSDAERQFISDLRLDMFVEEAVKRGTEWAVFEPKDDQLFNSLTSQISGLMLNLWQQGKLLGSTPEEAFFVKCDKEINPDILSSELNIEVGYAKKKPAEFVVTRISHKQN